MVLPSHCWRSATGQLVHVQLPAKLLLNISLPSIHSYVGFLVHSAFMLDDPLVLLLHLCLQLFVVNLKGLIILILLFLQVIHLRVIVLYLQ